MKLTSRIAWVALLLLSGLRPAEASRISVNELNEGGGTIINDGTGDVASSNGSANGETSLMSELGLRDGFLADDLSLLHITGFITDSNNIATSADLNVIRIYGTVQSEVGCPNCVTPNSVNVGDDAGASQEIRNVLFAFDVV